MKYIATLCSDIYSNDIDCIIEGKFAVKILCYLVKELVIKARAKLIDGHFLYFLDPWGNRIQIVEYANIQFTKAPQVLKGVHS